MYRRGPTKTMEIARLQRQLTELTDNMFAEGLLDDQFTQLQQLQDESNPEFVGEVIGLFFEDSEKLLEDLTAEVIGAQRVKAVCIDFRNYCEDEDRAACLQALEQVKQEFNLVKNKLELMLSLEQQILAKGGQLPFMMD
eukprot:jgi/Mesen1/5550/ME000280S04671